MLTPKTVARAGSELYFSTSRNYHAVYHSAISIHSKCSAKDFGQCERLIHIVDGPSVAPIPFTPDAGLGQSVYTAKRSSGSGYVQQWNLAVQRAITNNLSVDIAYVGSHVVHVGIPDSNLNQLTASQLAEGQPTQTGFKPFLWSASPL